MDYINELEEKGYVVIPNVLDEKECDQAIDGIWKWLEGLGTGIKRDDPSTWKSKNWPPNIHGIIQCLSIGQTKFVWDVRTHPNVYKVFSKIWKTKRLLASYDGACVMKPPEITKRWNRQRSWYHRDQTFRRPEKVCIQGFITLEDMGPEDGTLCVLEGSHRLGDEFCEWKREKDPSWKPGRENWYKLKNDETEWFHSKTTEVKIDASKGSLVLWDSRTIHQNKWPDKGRENPRWRYVIYSCMLPADGASPKDLKKRSDAIKNLRMTTHWPYPVTLFPKMPRSYGNPFPDYKTITEMPELNELQERLAGIKPYDHIKGLKSSR